MGSIYLPKIVYVHRKFQWMQILVLPLYMLVSVTLKKKHNELEVLISLLIYLLISIMAQKIGWGRGGGSERPGVPPPFLNVFHLGSGSAPGLLLLNVHFI